MFRKPKFNKKKGKKESLRRKRDEENDSDDHTSDAGDGNAKEEESTLDLISEARKRFKTGSHTTTTTTTTSTAENPRAPTIASTASSAPSLLSNADLATRGALHLPTQQEVQQQQQQERSSGRGADGIYRDATRNKFHAGPIKASQNIRVTARFDYQPDVCKDYKDTGFCGYGDTCIYLHDRGDTMSGWQLEQQWEQQQAQKKQHEEAQLAQFMDGGGKSKPGETASDAAAVTENDHFPFACFLCRQAFVDPIVTSCQHYFCQSCILKHVQQDNNNKNNTDCPICHKDTQGVFHQPTKLISYQRRTLGVRDSKLENSWQLLFDKCSSSPPQESS